MVDGDVFPRRSWVRALFTIAILLFWLSTAVALDSPQPPCGTVQPHPDYSGIGATVNVHVWSQGELAGRWAPPTCTHWISNDGVLVALAARFRYAGTAEDLLFRIGAISSLTGLRYWSLTDNGWRTLITHATALDGPDLSRPRADFTAPELSGGHDLYFAESDNRSSGEVIYRMHVREAEPTRIVVEIENVSPVRRFLVTLFDRGALQSVHFLQRTAKGVWTYYGLARSETAVPSFVDIKEGSYVNRALAIYSHFAGIPPQRAHL